MLYLAHGSNLHPLRLRRRAPTAQLLGTVELADWGLHFHKRSVDGSGKCNIVKPGPGAFAAVYELSADDKRRLDEIEGVGRGYVDGRIRVTGYGECHVYLAADSHIEEDLRPYDWYTTIVGVGCRKLGFPAAYIEYVESIATLPDPDARRSRQNWRIVDELRRDTAPDNVWR